jgi:hypothetical protein
MRKQAKRQAELEKMMAEIDAEMEGEDRLIDEVKVCGIRSGYGIGYEH